MKTTLLINSQSLNFGNHMQNSAQHDKIFLHSDHLKCKWRRLWASPQPSYTDQLFTPIFVHMHGCKHCFYWWERNFLHENKVSITVPVYDQIRAIIVRHCFVSSLLQLFTQYSNHKNMVYSLCIEVWLAQSFWISKGRIKKKCMF